MKKQYIFQVCQDAILTIIFLVLMGFHLSNEIIHEWLGIFFFSIILLHISLNYHWIKKIANNDYDFFKSFQLTINVLLLIMIISAIGSGLMLSRHVLPDASFHSTTDLVRKVHMTSVHWGQIIIAVHLGMHWKMLANFFCRMWNIPPRSLFSARLMPFLFILIAVYGAFSFMARDMLPYLLLQVDFAFFDYEEPKWIFYLDYFATVISFAYLTRILLWLFLFRGARPIQ